MTLAFNNVSGIGSRGTGSIKVDGKDKILLIMQWSEYFDIGS